MEGIHGGMPAYETISPVMKKCWRISRLIFLGVTLVILAGVAAVCHFAQLPQPVPLILYCASAALFAYSVAAFLIYPEIEYRQWRYLITEDKVEIRHGIFFVETTVIPIVRIQHITISQGPIRRRFGLFGVKISLASGEHEIVGLTEEKAARVSDYLKTRLYVRLEEEGV